MAFGRSEVVMKFTQTSIRIHGLRLLGGDGGISANEAGEDTSQSLLNKKHDTVRWRKLARLPMALEGCSMVLAYESQH